MPGDRSAALRRCCSQKLSHQIAHLPIVDEAGTRLVDNHEVIDRIYENKLSAIAVGPEAAGRKVHEVHGLIRYPPEIAIANTEARRDFRPRGSTGFHPC